MAMFHWCLLFYIGYGVGYATAVGRVYVSTYVFVNSLIVWFRLKGYNRNVDAKGHTRISNSTGLGDPDHNSKRHVRPSSADSRIMKAKKGKNAELPVEYRQRSLTPVESPHRGWKL